MTSEELFVMVVLLAMASGVLIVVLGLRQRAHQLELAHRERMAMIDRGILPTPESNPGHATWSGPAGSHPQGVSRYQSAGHAGAASQRSMTLGIVIVAIGIGFMILIGIAAREPNVAIGIGGAIAVVGVAFIVIAQIRRTSLPAQSLQPPPLPVTRPYSTSERPPEPPL